MHLFKIGDALNCIIRTTLLILIPLLTVAQERESPCDLMIFQNGTINNGTVTLFPQIIGDLTCKKNQDCDQQRKLISWTMKNCVDCTNIIGDINLKTDDVIFIDTENLKNQNQDIRSTKDLETNSKAVALKDGSEIKLILNVEPNNKDYVSLTALAYNVKLMRSSGELANNDKSNVSSTLTRYLMTFKVDDKILFQEERTIDKEWQHKKIYLSSLNQHSGVLIKAKSKIEVDFKMNSIKGENYLLIDELDILGKACQNQKDIDYSWSTGEKTETIRFDNPGDYCVTITDCNGCVATDCISLD